VGGAPFTSYPDISEQLEEKRSADTSQEIVDRFVKSLVGQRIDDARRMLHDDLVVDEAGGLPFSGQYNGPQGFVDLLEKITANLDLTLNPAIEYLHTGATVAMRTRMKFTARSSGKSVETGLLEIYTIRDGLIVQLDVYYKDPSAVAALLAN
jgi:uncharacterized protein